MSDDVAVLKKLVTEALAKRGVINKLKAELRANVFSVIHEKQENTLPPTKKSPEVEQALDVVCDFLRSLGLLSTLSVLECEANIAGRRNVPAKTLMQLMRQPNLEVDTSKTQPGDMKQEGVNVAKCMSPTPLDMISPPAYFGNEDDVADDVVDTADDFALTAEMRYDYSEDVK